MSLNIFTLFPPGIRFIYRVILPYLTEFTYVRYDRRSTNSLREMYIIFAVVYSIDRSTAGDTSNLSEKNEK